MLPTDPSTYHLPTQRLTTHLPRPTIELKTDDEIAEQAGGNLFTDTPEIRAWLLGVEKGKDLVVGGACVRVCMG